MAETAALEAALRAGRDGVAARPHPASRRRIPFRDGHCRLCCLDLAAPVAFGGFRMDGAMCRRLAQTLARLNPHPLPRQGRARRARVMLSGFPESLSAGRPKLAGLSNLPKAHHAT